MRKLHHFLSIVLFGALAFTHWCENLRGYEPMDAEHKQQVENWRKVHEDTFRSPSGWLALIGHVWLQEGNNDIGIGEKFPISLPTDLGLNALGTFQVQGNQVILEVPDGSDIRVDGKEVRRSTIAIDALKADANSENKIQIGERIQLQLVRRNHRLAIRIRDKESNSIKEFKGKNWFPINPEFKVEAEFVPYEPPKPIKIINIRGEEIESELVGKLMFQMFGEKLELDAISESPGELSILFKDKTNSTTTYQPGRFLDVKMPEGRRVILDFNQAYNPPCAFSAHTLCPLPPKQNHLGIAIEAGERRYR